MRRKRGEEEKRRKTYLTRNHQQQVYLTHIIDHYDSLPDITYFHHAHYQSWHQRTTTIWELTTLRPSFIVQSGYVNTHIQKGCENLMSISPHTVPASSLSGNNRDVQLSSLFREFGGEEMLVNIFGGAVEGKAQIAAPCCAQFAVSREAIRRRSKEVWMGLREWLKETPVKDEWSGRLFEWSWHLWFGMEQKL